MADDEEEMADDAALGPPEEGEEEIVNPAEIEDVEYHNQVWVGTLPAPQGKVPTELHKFSFADQRTHAASFFTFLTSEDRNDLMLNDDTNPITTALIQVPKTNKVRVIYLLGIGTRGFNNTNNAVAGKVLALTHDGGGPEGPPQVMILPKSVLERKNVPALTLDRFKIKLAAEGSTYTYPLVRRNDNQVNIVNILQVAPVPPYLVYDGFQHDLDAADLLERIIGMTNDTVSDMRTHLESFLRACLTAQNVMDNKSYMSLEAFVTPVSETARKWANTKFQGAFPHLTQPVPTQPQGGQDSQMAQLLQLLAAKHVGGGTPRIEEEKKHDTTDFGLSSMEKEKLLVMCGFDKHDAAVHLPDWIKRFAEPNMSKTSKASVVQELLNPAKHYFDDAELHLTSSLIKMVVNREWLGKEGNFTRPTYLTCMEGISPFAMKDYSDDSIALINTEDGHLEDATHITVSDRRHQKSHQRPEVPSSPYQLLKLIKKLGNFLFVIFSNACPLFIQVEMVIDAFTKCSDRARHNMTAASCASMLWILLLQCREFSQGRLEVLSEFEELLRSLQRKNLSIKHDECPLERLIPPAGPKRPLDTSGGGSPPIPESNTKKQKVSAPWHPELKAALEGPLKKHTNSDTNETPPLSKLLKYSTGSAFMQGLRPGMNTCLTYLVLNKCKFGDSCRRQHLTATDAQAKVIKNALKKFIENPNDLPTG